MADLEANLMHLQLMHESLSRFGESFASFLYGLNMNAFVVDFPEVSVTELLYLDPIDPSIHPATTCADLSDHKRVFFQAPLPESIKRYQKRQRAQEGGVVDDTTILTGGDSKTGEAETTIMAGDASFASLKATPRRKTVGSSVTPSTASTAKQSTTSSSTRGGIPSRAGRGASRGGRGSGLPRGRGRGIK